MEPRKNVPAREPEFAITRLFEAPREIVFEAWTDPRYVALWWGPHGFTTPFCEMEARERGHFRLCARSSQGEETWHQGIYHEVKAPERVVSTMSFANEQGDFVSPTTYGYGVDFPSQIQDVVTFTCHEGDRTKLTLRRNYSDALAKFYKEDERWDQALERLSHVVRAMAARAHNSKSWEPTASPA